MPIALVVLGVVVVVLWLRRQRELFCLSVRDGHLLLVRGRIPPGLCGDFREAVSGRPVVRRATIKAYRGEHGAELSVSGDIADGRTQRLRNIFSIYPLSRLRAAPPPDQRSVGQMLGIAWLAWILHRNG